MIVVRHLVAGLVAAAACACATNPIRSAVVDDGLNKLSVELSYRSMSSRRVDVVMRVRSRAWRDSSFLMARVIPKEGLVVSEGAGSWAGRLSRRAVRVLRVPLEADEGLAQASANVVLRDGMTNDLLFGVGLTFAVENDRARLEKARELPLSNWGYKRVRFGK